MDIFDRLDEAQARLDELSKATLGSYVKKAHVDKARHEKASDNMNIARRAMDDVSYSSAVRSIKQPEGEKASHEVLNHAGSIMRKAAMKHDDKAFNRKMGIHKAMSRLTKEDVDLVESAEELQELSKDTLRSYASKATDSVAGRGRKSAKKLNRVSNVELAKQKLGKILDKEHAAREKTRTAHATEIQNHFQKEAPKVLAKHGFSKVHQTEAASVYHKGHENGHSTVVRISHKDPYTNHYGSKFSMNSTSGSGTLNGQNHVVDHSESAEHNKSKMMNSFEQHLISDHDHHKRWVTEGVEQTGDILEEGRRGRPPKDPAKRAAFNSSESDEPKMHIIAQLNKVKDSSVPTKVHFKDGSKHEVHSHHAEQILAKYAGMKPNEKIDFQQRVAQSHASLKSELK